MAEISLSIIELFKNQFGIKPDEFNFNKLQTPQQTASGKSALYAIDKFGRQYFMPVQIGLTGDAPIFLPGGNGTIKIPMAQLPYPVMSITAKKRFVNTPLTDRPGTVKELIDTYDYKIRIRGLMIGKNGQWPEDDYIRLNNLYKTQTSLIIRSALTDIFLVTPDRGGTDRVVITDLSFPESRGGINVRPYEMELESDQQFSLISIA